MQKEDLMETFFDVPCSSVDGEVPCLKPTVFNRSIRNKGDQHRGMTRHHGVWKSSATIFSNRWCPNVGAIPDLFKKSTNADFLKIQRPTLRNNLDVIIKAVSLIDCFFDGEVHKLKDYGGALGLPHEVVARFVRRIGLGKVWRVKLTRGVGVCPTAHCWEKHFFVTK